MKTRGNTLVYVALCAFLVVAAWLAGGRQAVEAQDTITTMSADEGEWRMFSQNVAGTGGSAQANEYGSASPGDPVYGNVWLYHSGTGELYFVSQNCSSTFSPCAQPAPHLAQ